MYFKDRYLLKALVINQENAALIKNFEAIVRQKIRTGGKAQDIIKLELELAKLSEAEFAIKKQRKIIKSQIKTLSHLDSVDFSMNHKAELNSQLPDLNEIQKLIQHSPSLITRNAQIELATEKMKLAHESSMPDFTVGLKTIFTGSSNSNVDDNGKDPIIISLGFTLPINTKKYDSIKAAAIEENEASKWAQIDTLHKLKSLVLEHSYNIEELQRNIRLYQKTLVPKLEQSIKLSQQSYRNGQSSILDILDLIRQNLAFKLQIEKDQFSKLQHITKLEVLCNREFIHTSKEEVK